MISDDKRKIDDPELNQDASTYDKNESFEETDDFHKYDDTSASNLDVKDPIVTSEDSTNANAKNATPTFTRTYDRNASDADKNLNDGKFDGEITI